jgi:hypothetical protein
VVRSADVKPRWATLSIFVATVAFGAWGLMHSCKGHAPVPVAKVEAEPPVPAPAELVAEAVAASPDTTWRKVQTTLGGALVLAPPTFRQLLAAVASVPTLATVVDGESPAYAAVGQDGRWVVAARAVSAQTARSTLEADAASNLRFDSHAGSIDVLAGTRTWVGVAGTWVLVGSDRRAIVELGPYAYRTLPTRPLPKADLAATARHAALAGPIRAFVDREWRTVHAFLLDKDAEQRRAHGGRAPDLGDPKALVDELDAIEAAYATRVTDMDHADATLVLDADSVHARVTLAPPRAGEARSWFDDLRGGPTEPLASSSAGALATLYWRSDPAARERAAKETAETLTRMIGARIPEGDEKKMGAALDGIARARGDWAVATAAGGAQTGGLLRLATSDDATIRASIESLVDLASQPSWAKWERDGLGVTKVQRSGARATFTLARGDLQASWSSRPGELDLAAGLDAQAVLASAAGQVTLASDAKVASWLRSLSNDVVMALVARPLLLASSPRSDAALVAVLREPDTVALDASLSAILARELLAAARNL